MRIASFAVLALTAAVSACASVPLESSRAEDVAPRLQAAQAPELDAAAYPVLLYAIERQRPTLLSVRGRGELLVEVNGAPANLDALRSIRTADVLEVRRVSSARVSHGQALLRVRLR